MRIQSFAGVDLPNIQSDFEANFGTNQTSIASVANGGGVLYRTGYGVPVAGMVAVTVYPKGSTDDEFQAVLDSLGGLADKGNDTLKAGFYDGEVLRCTARILSISRIGSGRRNAPHRVVWEVPSPRWLSDTEKSATQSSATGTTNTAIYNAGNVYALPVVTINATSSVSPLTLKILDGSTEIDTFTYSGTLATSGTMIVDCRSKSITVNGTSIYANQTYTSVDMLRILSGSMTFRTQITGTANVTIAYRDAYLRD